MHAKTADKNQVILSPHVVRSCFYVTLGFDGSKVVRVFPLKLHAYFIKLDVLYRLN